MIINKNESQILFDFGAIRYKYINRKGRNGNN